MIIMNEINRILRSHCDETVDVEKIFDFDQIPHFCIPSMNNSFEEDRKSLNFVRYCVESYDKMPYVVSSSLPFGESALLSSEHLNGLDPALELANSKKKWENRKNKIILANLNCKGLQMLKKKKKNVRTVSSGILKLAEHLNSDPDPNFSVQLGYNWYYSGGTLNAVSFNNSYFLLATRGSLPGILQVTPLNVSEAHCVPIEDKKLFLHANDQQPIFQTVVKNKFVAVRQKNFATLFVLGNEKKLKFKKIHTSCETEDSIVSLAISDQIDGEYCTLSTSHTLKLWSPERKNCKFSHKFDDKYCKKSCDHWGSINYFSNHYIIFSSRDCIYLKDKRTNLNADLKYFPPKSEFNCNYISLIMKSNLNDRTVFVGTKHNLLELDIRKTYRKEWVHMMEYAPMYGTSCPIIDGSEVVFTSSQNLNEVCLIESNNKSMPFLLPSPNEMVVNAKIQGLCLDSVSTTRCNFSIIGLTCIPFENKSSKGVYVFRSTSVGDVFYQKVENEKDSSEALNVERNVRIDFEKEVLLDWERRSQKAIENIAVKLLEVTDVVDKRETFMCLRKNEKRYVSGLMKKKYDEEKNCFEKWRISKKRLLELDDPLAQCLLDVWEIDDIDEWHEKGKRKSNEFIVDKQTDSNSKIESWFSQLPDNPNLSLPTTSKNVSIPDENSKQPLNLLCHDSSSVPFMKNLSGSYGAFDLGDDLFDRDEQFTDAKRTSIFPNLGIGSKKLNNLTVNSRLSSGF